jgi:hypothetical protein
VSGCSRTGQVQRFAPLTVGIPLPDILAAIKARFRGGMVQRAALMMAIGLLLGPIYSTFWESLSGTLHEGHALTERSDRWTLPDGSIQRFRGGLAYRPVTLKLTPEMNRVRLRLAFETARNATESTTGNEYLATLLDVDHPVFERSLQLTVAPGGKATLDVRAFEVFAPTEYLFLLEEVGKPTLDVSSVTLEVWERAEPAFKPVVWCGFGLLLIGMGMAVYGLLTEHKPRLRA